MKNKSKIKLDAVHKKMNIFFESFSRDDFLAISRDFGSGSKSSYESIKHSKEFSLLSKPPKRLEEMCEMNKMIDSYKNRSLQNVGLLSDTLNDNEKQEIEDKNLQVLSLKEKNQKQSTEETRTTLKTAGGSMDKLKTNISLLDRYNSIITERYFIPCLIKSIGSLSASTYTSKQSTLREVWDMVQSIDFKQNKHTTVYTVLALKLTNSTFGKRLWMGEDQSTNTYKTTFEHLINLHNRIVSCVLSMYGGAGRLVVSSQFVTNIQNMIVYYLKKLLERGVKIGKVECAYLDEKIVGDTKYECYMKNVQDTIGVIYNIFSNQLCANSFLFKRAIEIVENQNLIGNRSNVNGEGEVIEEGGLESVGEGSDEEGGPSDKKERKIEKSDDQIDSKPFVKQVKEMYKLIDYYRSITLSYLHDLKTISKQLNEKFIEELVNHIKTKLEGLQKNKIIRKVVDQELTSLIKEKLIFKSLVIPPEDVQNHNK